MIARLMLAVPRAFQGAFGAILAPAALSLLTTTFTETDERNKAFGVYGAIAGSGASIGLLLGGVLTQTLDWRFSMYVNDVIAVFALSGALVLLHNVRDSGRSRLDLGGTIAVSLGLFAVVFGFNRAQIDGWTAAVTLISLVVGAVLLLGFALLETRMAHPLMPMRVVTNRNRGASFLAMLLSAAAMFGVFLFLTYYLQEARGYSPIKSGLAFLPMTGIIMITAVTVSTVLLVRVGPKLLVTAGMILAAVGMALFTRIGVSTSFLWPILPGELVMGMGLGFIFAAMNSSTIGVAPGDAGVASALVNACQQVGGALGTALLSTIAASAATAFVTGHAAGIHSLAGRALLAERASIHGYTTAFWISALVFAVGAGLSALLYERGLKVTAESMGGEPVLAH